MISPDSDLGKLLKAMGAYQDQQRAKTGDYVTPVMVRADWPFHEQRTGLGREEILRLLPQLVAEGLAEGLGSGKGMPFGYRVSDGFATITAQGQRQLTEWENPATPTRVEIAGFGLQAQMQLEALITRAAELGITKGDVDRLEQILQGIANDTGTDKTAQAADLAHLFTFFNASVFPFLRSVVDG